MAIQVYTYRMSPPGPLFSATTDEKFNYSEIQDTVADLKDYPVNHEVLGVIIYVPDRMYTGIHTTAKFYNDDTGALLWQGTENRPDPAEEGWEWWNWQKVKYWIGHCDWEIKGPMLIRAVVTVDGVEYVRTIRVTDSSQPSEPNPATISGNVYDVKTGAKLPGATVQTGYNSTTTDSNGNYSIQSTVIGLITVSASKDGYVSKSVAITVSEGQMIGLSIGLTPVPEEPEPEGYQYKKLPAPPTNFPTKFIPTYQELDQACYDNDATKVMEILRAHHLDEGSPVAFLAVIGAIVGVLGIIITIVGSYPFSAFLFEETLQTLDMAIYEAEANKQWDLALIAANKKAEFLEQGWISSWKAAIPVLNVVNAVTRYVEASTFKLSIDQKLIERQISNVQQPSTPQFSQYYNALEQGQDPAPYAPKAYGILKITSNAPGGEILIDGVGWSAMLPFSIELLQGSHEVELRAEGYTSQTKTVLLTAYGDQVVDFQLTQGEEPEGEQPSEELIIPLEPAGPSWNSWKVTIHAIDSETRAPLAAWVLINDNFIGKSTPAIVYMYPEATYNVKLRLKGYYQGEVTFTTKPLPTT